jgi:hypothetical protein
MIQREPKILSYLDPTGVKKDLEDLKAKAQTITKFANKRFAHFDKEGPKSIPTYQDVDDCLEFLEQLLKKYWKLIHGAQCESVLPVWQYDWKEIFREPWINSRV